MRFLNCITPNLNPEENEREKNIQKKYIWRPVRQTYAFCTQFLPLMSVGVLV